MIHAINDDNFPRLLDCIRIGLTVKAALRAIGVESHTTLMYYLRAHPKRRPEYVQARIDRAEALEEDIIEIADDPEIPADKARVRIEARRRVMAYANPGKYGDKLDVNLNQQISLRSALDAADARLLPAVPVPQLADIIGEFAHVITDPESVHASHDDIDPFT